MNRDVFIVASDRYVAFTKVLGVLQDEGYKNAECMCTDICRSEALVRIAMQHQPHSTIVADILSLPHPASYFDFAISIAVVHHLSTPERRIQAISAILQTLKPVSPETSDGGGKALIYVWALEQKSSRRGWDKGHEQDVMVPWVMRNKPAAASKKQENEHEEQPPQQDKVFHRFYHLYEESELERDIRAAGGVVIESGYEKDNWWAIASRSK